MKAQQRQKMTNNLLNINHNTATVIKELESYTHNFFDMLQIKRFNLTDLFFGILNEKASFTLKEDPVEEDALHITHRGNTI